MARRKSPSDLHTVSILGVVWILIFVVLFWLPITPVQTPSPVELSQAANDSDSGGTPLGGGGTALHGWAWSSNIGWISFNCNNYFNGVSVLENHCSSSNYSVVHNGTKLEGWAWANPRDMVGMSDNLGWIKFGGLSGCPGGGSCDATFSGNQLTGWARFCGGTVKAGDDPANPTHPGDCSTMTSRPDGWDGWIKLSGAAQDGSPFGVSKSASGAYTGYAWGSNTVGWINFNAASPGQTTVIPPDCDSSQVCEGDPGGTNALAVTCSSNPSGDVNPGDSVLWSATLPSGGSGSGTEPYHYSWDATGANPSTGSESTLDTSYGTPGVYNTRVTVSDSSDPPLFGTGDCPVLSVGGALPAAAGALDIPEAYNQIVIRSQASGQPANTIVADRSTANDGRGGVVVPITNVGGTRVDNMQMTIRSQKPGSSDLFSYTGSQRPLCQFSLNTYDDSRQFKDCGTLPYSYLDPGQTLYFRLQVPTPRAAVAQNNPYAITFSGISTDPDTGNSALVVPVMVIFDYLVTSFDPI